MNEHLHDLLDLERIDNAEVIHAPGGDDPDPVDLYKQRTACGRALRAMSDDITTPTVEVFEYVTTWKPGWVDDRLCRECKTIVS